MGSVWIYTLCLLCGIIGHILGRWVEFNEWRMSANSHHHSIKRGNSWYHVEVEKITGEASCEGG